MVKSVCEAASESYDSIPQVVSVSGDVVVVLNVTECCSSLYQLRDDLKERMRDKVVRFYL